MLRLDVARLVAVHRVHERWQVELGEVGATEACVAVGAPLHRGADAVAVAEVDVVAHTDLVPVIQDRGPRKREEQAVEELHLAAAVVEQRRQPAPDPEVELHARVLRVLPPHVVALVIGDHLQGELVVVAQEDAPLRRRRDRRSALEDLGDRVALLAPQPHEHARHDREVEAHVTLGAFGGAEVVDDVLGPLVGLGEHHPGAGVFPVDHGAQLGEECVGLGEVLGASPLAGEQVGHSIEAEAIHAQVEPEAHHVEHLSAHRRVVVVEVGLVAEEAVPVVGACLVVPGPVRGLGVDEDDPRVLVALRGLAPDVPVALGVVR